MTRAERGMAVRLVSHERAPLGVAQAAIAVARCVAVTAALLARRRIHQPRTWVGRRLRFADGTSAPVYRETVVDRGPTREPCVLVVEFRLRVVRGRAHALFRWESELNTPLFVGFPGFVSKLWLAHDDNDVYRGFYEWDGPELAERYARALYRVLALVSVPGSIHYRVVWGLGRDEALAEPGRLGHGAEAEPSAWWWPVAVS